MGQVIGRSWATRPGWYRAVVVLTATFLGTTTVMSDQPQSCRLSDIRLDIDADKMSKRRAELSGIVIRRDELVVVSNEAIDKKKRKHMVQLYGGSPDAGYRHTRDVLLMDAPEDCSEADFEALTSHGDTIFAITSHSIDGKAPAGPACGTRHQLLKFMLADGRADAHITESASLKSLIEDHPVLKSFVGRPAKQGGIDIEGLLAVGGSLLAGFRGPILDGALTPVLRLPQALSTITATSTELLTVDLGGRGIRDMAARPDGGIVILAGPTGAEERSFQVLGWPQARTGAPATLLCDLGLSDAKGHKPEGIAYLDTTSAGQRFVLVYDGKESLLARLLVLPVR